ncbi:M1 family metallopeptidase [Hyunsoonleella sp. SJ7]|uniref:Aminopeptidase N n=1 Tax=Hyunsoonleella aquatilis TaxID=2762758 RepID=A0A923HIB1_9FLAO|nr:M1 family metallopeptidase [Hyunsoonleella aquatilis]MBC3758882.1 M1 family metallopeptidase [Hyunsoonleella aquatilis]
MKTFVSLFLFFIAFSGISQQTETVDFKTAKAKININPNEKGVGGHISYTFEILKNTDSIYLDVQNFSHIEALLGDKIIHDYDGKHLIIRYPFKKGEIHQLDIGFVTQPKKALYFIDWDYENGNQQVWTQGQGKYTSNWLPSIDDMNEKIEFDLSITFDKNYEVVSNGNLTNKQINDSTITWHYDMKQPMPSYLVALAIGKYKKKVEYSKSGIPLEMYYYPQDSSKFEPTYRYTKQMFDFLEEEIGVPYPWQNYKMVPVKDFLYAGMENTTLNIYSDSFVVDSIGFEDRNFVNINAHELAHQWFGNLVTATSGTHHWLQEGFATYYALLAEKDIFGEDYYYWRLYEYAQELLAQDKAGQSTSLLNPKSSSTTFYKKGCWVLHMLRKKVGDEAFKTGVKNYLLKHQFKNVDTDDFIGEVEKASGKDLSEFFKAWFDISHFPKDAIVEGINNDYTSTTIMIDSHLIETAPETFSVIDNGDLIGYYNYKVISLLQEVDSSSLSTYKKALNSTLKTRQAVAKNLTDIPQELKKDYESLLNDKSYITVETTLFNLWKNFPEDRIKYLNQTKDIIGFNDKNVRLLWLTLALITEDYEPENKAKYFQELTGYTSPKYGFEVRQNAFQYLYQIKACNEACKNNLKQATAHHNWRFKKFARSLLEAD